MSGSWTRAGLCEMSDVDLGKGVEIGTQGLRFAVFNVDGACRRIAFASSSSNH